MAKLPFMQFYPADYLVDTMPLTPAARGLWMDVICMMWRSESRGTMTLSLDGWCKVLRCDKATWETTAWEFRQFNICDLVTNGNGTVTLRCRRMAREEKSRKSLRLRVQRHRSNAARNAPVPECNRDISEIRSHTSEVILQKSEEEKKNKTPVVPKGDFETFWEAYPRKHGKLAARRKWEQTKKLRPPIDVILLAIARAKQSDRWKKDGGEYIPNPATWLNQGRWADIHEIELPPAKPVVVGPKAYQPAPTIDDSNVEPCPPELRATFEKLGVRV